MKTLHIKNSPATEKKQTLDKINMRIYVILMVISKAEMDKIKFWAHFSIMLSTKPT